MPEQTRVGHVNQWLIRTSQNEILGPLTREELITRIQRGAVSGQDEVCQANHYWIYLDEKDEVMRQLGIALPRSSSANLEEEEKTDTETLTQELQDSHTLAAAPTLSVEQAEAFEKLQDPRERMPRGHEVLMPHASTSAHKNSHSKFKMNSSGQSQFQVLGHVERPSIWRALGTVLVVLAGLLVAWMIRVLQVRS